MWAGLWVTVLIVTSAAVCWLPGLVIARLLRVERHDPFARLGQQIALALAFWPVLFLITSAVHLHWSPLSARTALALLGVGALIVAERRRKWHRPQWFTVIVAIVLAIVVYTRIEQIRGVAFPLWVDSVHHTMIIRLLVEAGALPASYAPFIANSSFYYHWGFHAIVAFIAWVAGTVAPPVLPQLLLVVGQLMNVLIFFAVYAGGVVLFRNRRVALLASTLATVVSYFPAYYVSWGRYTQLCGLVLLPPAAVAFWYVLRHPSWRRAAELTILSAGLLLIHVRVAIVFALLCCCLCVVALLQRRPRGLLFAAAAAVIAIALVSPWLLHLVHVPQISTMASPTGAERTRWEPDNRAPDDLLWAPNNVALFITATGGLFGLTPLKSLTTGWRIVAVAWWLLLVVLLQRRSSRSRDMPRLKRFNGWRYAIPLVWTAVVAFAINADRVGLRKMGVVTNSAAIAMLFLPVSLAAAHLVCRSADGSLPLQVRHTGAVAVTLVTAIAGASTMLHVINPQTLLATAADARALQWIATHTPRDSRFGVGVQPWIGGSFVGVDGGYWIRLVTDRASILPPGLYLWVLPTREADFMTERLSSWYDAQQKGILSTPVLRANGITHLYFGNRNATPLRAAAAASPFLERVYDRDGVEIYKVKG